MERIVLLPDRTAVESYRKRVAREGGDESFGVAVETPASWLGSLWDVWGDGRRVAARHQRELAFSKALSATSAIVSSSGSISMLMRLADEGLGTSGLDAALEKGSVLDGEFGALLTAVRTYERILSDACLIDPGRAWGILGDRRVVRRPAALKVRGLDLSAPLREFCEKQSHLVLDEEATPVIGPAAEGVQVRFAFPAGRHARPLLLVDLLSDLSKNGSGETVVAARDPFSTYQSIAPVLARRGVSCSFEGNVAFAQTSFGAALFRARDALSRDLDVAACSDYLLSPFSGVSSDEAYAFDAWARADRLLTQGECLARIRQMSPTFDLFEELLSTPDAGILTGVLEDRVRGMKDASEAWKAEQLASISFMREVFEDARLVGAQIGECLGVLESGGVFAARVAGSEGPRIRVMDLRRASMLGAGTCSAVVMCDMTSAFYPLRERADAAEALLKAAGVPGVRSALSDARRTFSLAAALPTTHLVIERCLNDTNAAPTYPAAVVEEFVDCYRADPTDANEVDNRYALPPRFLGSVIERGEDSLYRNMAVSGDAQRCAAVVEMPSLARVSEGALARLVLPRTYDDDGAPTPPCFSASQIESYLECPQKWFALRRLRLRELDEGFGAVEMGDFSHCALERFYRRFQERIAPKVTEGLLSEARSIMGEVLCELRDEQYGRAPSSNRLVPVGELERRQARELEARLLSYLDREACLLPDFRPAELEFKITATKPVDYAGYKLMGAIDRIDVDGEGRAVIIDYKSSLSPDYDLYDSAGEERGGKVQTLIYAQAAQRLLGLDVAGAIYVSYGRSSRVSGAIDARIEPLHLPGIKASACTYASGPLSDLLDATEERVSRALDAMLSGNIDPMPAHAGACAWCPEISCPKRRG